jgi:hypothetical protein
MVLPGYSYSGFAVAVKSTSFGAGWQIKKQLLYTSSAVFEKALWNPVCILPADGILAGDSPRSDRDLRGEFPADVANK